MNLNKKKYTLAVLDFGSSACRLVLAARQNNKLALKAFLSEPIRRYGTFDGLPSRTKNSSVQGKQNFYLEVIKRAASKLIESAGGVGALRRHRVVLGLPADCLKARVVRLSYERSGDEQKINAAEAKTIYQKIYQQARDQILKQLDEEGVLLPQEIKFLRVRVLGIKISGYGVPQINGFKGKRLDFQILVIYLNNTIYQDYQRVIEDIGLNEGQIYHEVEGLLKCQASFNARQLILVDIGSQFSQFFVFHDGLLEQTGDFNGGSEDFSLMMAEKLKLSEDEAEEMKYKYATGVLSEKASEKIQNIFEPAALEWANNFKAAVKETRLANFEMVFIGGGSQLPDLIKIARQTTGSSFKVSLRPDHSIKFDVNDLPLINSGQIPLTVRDVSSLLLAFAG